MSEFCREKPQYADDGGTHRALIAIAVYVVGGCVYQRNVMHQRGWRQLPNYAIWAGIGSFVKVPPPRPPQTNFLP